MRISTKAVSFMAVGLFAVGLSVGTIGGCSSSSGSSYKDLCLQGCAKLESCNPDGGALIASYCQTSCNKQETCSNESARISAAQACLKISDCTQFEACGQSIPECQTTTGGAGSSGTGTGGTTGSAGHAGATGGTTGGGGSSGSGSCATCDKAATCCTTLGGSAAQCGQLSASMCNAMTGSNQSNYIAACQAVLTSAGAACP